MRPTRCWLAVAAFAPCLLPAQGVVLRQWTTRGDTVTYTYVVQPSADGSLATRIVIDVRAPASVRGAVLPDARGILPFDASGRLVGHPTLRIQCPTRGAWDPGIDPTGGAYCRGARTAIDAVTGLQAGASAATVTLSSVGLPFVREAQLQPWRPLPVYDERADAMREGAYPANRPRGEVVTTLVAGPGVPREALTGAQVEAQLALVCRARVWPEGVCQAVLTSARSGAWNDVAVVLRTHTPHTWVRQVLEQQIPLLR